LSSDSSMRSQAPAASVGARMSLEDKNSAGCRRCGRALCVVETRVFVS
jgi:hypothetical protein